MTGKKNPPDGHPARKKKKNNDSSCYQKGAKKSMGVKGYKAFNSDWTCRNFQYEVGKTYEYDGQIKLCERGFHFCERLAKCFDNYPFRGKLKIAEVEALGSVETNGVKSVTDRILIRDEIPWETVLRLVNSGDRNTGYGNTGDRNTGDRNTGYRNTGDRNTGDRNTGDWNTGDRNTGSWNTGSWNSGDENSGDWNTGDRNTGDGNSGSWNSGDGNSGRFNSCDNSAGFFCSVTPPIYLFNKPTDLTYEQVIALPGMRLLNSAPTAAWVDHADMTDEEKADHPGCETTGGYLKALPYKESWARAWAQFTEAEKANVLAIPKFDPDVFLGITGIDVRLEQPE